MIIFNGSRNVQWLKMAVNDQSNHAFIGKNVKIYNATTYVTTAQRPDSHIATNDN